MEWCEFQLAEEFTSLLFEEVMLSENKRLNSPESASFNFSANFQEEFSGYPWITGILPEFNIGELNNWFSELIPKFICLRYVSLSYTLTHLWTEYWSSWIAWKLHHPQITSCFAFRSLKLFLYCCSLWNRSLNFFSDYRFLSLYYSTSFIAFLHSFILLLFMELCFKYVEWTPL